LVTLRDIEHVERFGATLRAMRGAAASAVTEAGPCAAASNGNPR
jgi:hypothetical protein